MSDGSNQQAKTYTIYTPYSGIIAKDVTGLEAMKTILGYGGLSWEIKEEENNGIKRWRLYAESVDDSNTYGTLSMNKTSIYSTAHNLEDATKEIAGDIVKMTRPDGPNAVENELHDLPKFTHITTEIESAIGVPFGIIVILAAIILTLVAIKILNH